MKAYNAALQLIAQQKADNGLPFIEQWTCMFYAMPADLKYKVIYIYPTELSGLKPGF